MTEDKHISDRLHGGGMALAAAMCAVLISCSGQDGQLRLHYDAPAACFEEALPIGNGRLGAMIYGGIDEDRLSLNDITLWTGEGEKAPKDYVCGSQLGKYEDGEWIPMIRQALEQGDYARAEELQRHVQGHYSEAYQPLGTLRIKYAQAPEGTYGRWLDISDATTGVSVGEHRREYFASSPDSAIVIRLHDPHGIRARVSLECLLPHGTVSSPVQADKGQGAQIDLRGYAAYHSYPGYHIPEGVEQFLYDPDRGIHFRTLVRAVAESGTVSAEGEDLILDGCREVTILITNATSFNGPFKDPVREGLDYVGDAERIMERASAKGASRLLKDHKDDYKRFFDRVSLDLGQTDPAVAALPTDEQLRRYSELGEANPQLEVLYFQYGRYLLICSSRTPGVPANLQGLWNEYLSPPWSCNYTVNINLEENYWPAETAALPEMHESLLGFVHHLSANGEAPARNFYGVKRGWNCGHNSDIWAMATPVGEGSGAPRWANWTMGGAWLSTHIWEHYLFTRDRQALQRDYPVLKGAAEFCLDWLTERDGELITSPGTSPENSFVAPDGRVLSTMYGMTADLAIIRECLTAAAGAAEALGLDGELVAEARSALPRLRPYHAGADGALMEWYYDWPAQDPVHRHQSHLIGLYPGHFDGQVPSDRIVPQEEGTAIYDVESFRRACARTLEIKGFETTGWSCGWRVNLHARLGDSESAYRQLRRLLQYVPTGAQAEDRSWQSGGTYPNLLDAHPPFQIDGNLGGTAGIIEMLVQSGADGSVTTLPALPTAWRCGRLRGVRTRAGSAIDLSWRDGRVTRLREYTPTRH